MTAWLLAAALARAAPGSTPDPTPAVRVEHAGVADGGVAQAVLDQATLPALTQRRLAAEARAGAAERYFAGQGALEAAFPDLAGAPLGDPGYLAGLAARLRDAGIARAAERITAPDPRLPPKDAIRWTAELKRTCDAEDRADQLLGRLIDGLVAGLAKAPSLTDAALAEVRAEWAATRARAAGADPSTPDGEAALDAAAVAGDAEARLARLRDLAWRALTVPGDRGLSEAVAAELEAWSTEGAATDVHADPRELRLRAVAPIVPGQEGDALRAALDARERDRLNASLAAIGAATSAPPLPTAAPALAAVVTDLEAQVTQLTAERDALDPVPDGAGPDDLPALRHRELDARLEAATRALADARAALTARQQLDAAGMGASTASADEAQKRADEARREAEKQAGTLERRLREQIATMREREATVVRAEQDRQQAAAAAFQDLSRQVAAQHDALAAALSLPPLAKERQSAFDAAYRSAWELVDAIRAAEVAATTELYRITAENATMLSDLGGAVESTGGGSAEMTALLAEQQQARSELAGILADRASAAAAGRVALARLLQEGKAGRRAARTHASGAARLIIQRRFLEDLGQEVTEAPMRIRLYLSELAGFALGLPQAMLDLSTWTTFLRASFALVLVVGGWWFARARVREAVTAVADALVARRPASAGWADRLAEAVRDRLVPGPPHAAIAPATRLAIWMIDLVGAALAFALLRNDLDVAALLGWILLAWLSLRLVQPLVHLSLVPTGGVGPGLAVVTPATVELAERSLRIVVVWWFTWRIAWVIALAVLDADRMADLVAAARFFSLLAIAVTLLSAWSDRIRTAVAAEDPSSAPIRWAAAVERGPARVVAAAVGLGWLGWRWALDRVLPSLATNQWFYWVYWIESVRARRALARPIAPCRPVSAAVRARIDAVTPRPSLHEEAMDAILREFTASVDAARRGLMAVTSSGPVSRAHALDRLAADLRDGGADVVRLTAPVVRDANAARRWLAEQLGLPEAAAADLDGLARAIERLPKRAILVDDMHCVLLRAVHGFGALRELLDVMHQSSEEQFWVIGMHGPAWDYLAHASGAVDLNIVRVHVRLPALRPSDLAELIGQVAREAGLALDFDDLAQLDPGVTGRERVRRVDSARHAYWRLLADASDGDAFVALASWADALGADGDDQGDSVRVSVRAPAIPPAARLAALDDVALFLLTALHVHHRLSLADAARSLNLGAPTLATVCRHLASEGMVQSADDGLTYSIDARWRAAIARRLAQRHLFHLGS